MRRLAVLFVALITFAGCGAGESGAVGLGDSSLTMEELNELSAAFGLVPRGENPASADANQLRNVATVYAGNLALLDFLESNGVDTQGPLLDEARASIDRGIESEQIGELDRSREPYNAAVDNAFLAAQPFENFFDGELPSVFEDPPVIENVEQLEIQSVIASPLVADNPEVQNSAQLMEKMRDPEFVQQLLEEPDVVLELRFNETLVRRQEIANDYGNQYFIESRLGMWDKELGQIVSR